MPPDDLPPVTTTDVDAELHRQLGLSMRQHFFEACDGAIQSLLMGRMQVFWGDLWGGSKARKKGWDNRPVPKKNRS
jgi:hypothetical protein